MSHMVKKALSGRIETARKHAALSGRDLAELVGVNLRTIWRWEAGERVPSLVELCKVAAYTDTSLVWLLHDVDAKRREIAREGED